MSKQLEPILTAAKNELLDSEYQIIEELPIAGQCTVYKVNLKQDETDETALTAKFSFLQTGPLEDKKHQEISGALTRGISAVNQLNCDYLAHIHTVKTAHVEDYLVILIVSDYFETDNLEQRLPGLFDASVVHWQRPSTSEIRSVADDILTALKAIHGLNVGETAVFHGNIRPSNIWFGRDGHIRISDLDWHQFLPADLDHEEIQGNPDQTFWMPPESLQNRKSANGRPGDIWALGVIFFQMIRGRHPFAGATPEAIIENVNNVSRKHTIQHLPVTITKLMDHMLDPDYTVRFNAVNSYHALQKIEFSKQCQFHHVNDFDAVLCQEPDCVYSFETRGEDLNTPEDGWTISNLVAQTLAPSAETFCKIKLYPGLNKEIRKSVDRAIDVGIYIESNSKQPLKSSTATITLLPPPRFDIDPEPIVIENAEKGSTVTKSILIKLVASHVIVNRIDAFMPTQEDVCIETSADWIGNYLHEPNTELPVELTFEFKEEIGKDFHPMEIVLHLEDRTDPIKIDRPQVKVASRHGLKLSQNIMNDQGIIEVFNVEKVRKKLTYLRQDNEELRIKKIIARNGHQAAAASPLDTVIKFDDILAKYKNQQIDNNYIFPFTVFPKRFAKTTFNQTIELHLEILENGKWEPRILSETINFERKELTPIDILAMDFGTTSSFAMVRFLDQGTREVVEKPIDIDYAIGDPFVDTVISYYSQHAPVSIGNDAKLFGNQRNLHRSFKGRIADGNHFYLNLKEDSTLEQKSADELILDYLVTFYSKIKEKYGYTVDHCVFTHPCQWSEVQTARFEEIIEKTEFDSSSMIDEATAAGISYIEDNRQFFIKEGRDTQSEYRLMVYDFGGGTIDIAYLKVCHTNTDYGLETQITPIDSGGIVDFGGNDVTNSIMEFFLEQFKKKNKEEENFPIELNSSDFSRAELRFRKDESEQEYSRKKELFEVIRDRAEYYKIKYLCGDNRSQEKLTQRIPVHNYTDAPGDPSREPQTREISIEVDPKVMEARFAHRLIPSLSIVKDILIRNFNARPSDASPVHIVLSGRSSALGIIQNFFNKLHQGEIPVLEAVDGEITFEPIDDLPDQWKNNISPPVLSSDPKKCVASGAMFIESNELYPSDHSLILVRQDDNDKTSPRIGIETTHNGQLKFEQLLSRNATLFDSNKNFEDKVSQNDFTNIGKKDMILNFSPKGSLLTKIRIWEHTGAGDNISGNNCHYRGVLKMRTKIQGIQRKIPGTLYLAAGSEHSLYAMFFIEGQKIQAEILT